MKTKYEPMKVDLIDFMGNDLRVVNAARVSFDKESFWEWGHKLSEQDEKLIDYLAREKHTSPFNHQFFSFRVKAPIFVARQLVKHEYLVWNEVSRRYVDTQPSFYLPEEWRESVPNKKQGSGGSVDKALNEHLTKHSKLTVQDCLDLYHFALDQGVCAEQARMLLPINMNTEWIWSGSFFAFMRMCLLRTADNSQEETKEVAEQVLAKLREYMPVSTTTMEKYAGKY